MTPHTVAALTPTAEQLALWRARLDTRFPEVDDVFAACAGQAAALLSPQGLDAYLDQARWLGRLGRGVEPMLIFLATWPQASRHVGEAALHYWIEAVQSLYKSPNSKDIAALLQCLGALAPRLGSDKALALFVQGLLDMVAQTSLSIHGRQRTHPSPGLPDLLAQSAHIVTQVGVNGWLRWVNNGVRLYPDHPEQQKAYFSLSSSESLTALQRERPGLLLLDAQRSLDLYLRALWNSEDTLVPIPSETNPDTDTQDSSDAESLAKPVPYLGDDGVRLPDCYSGYRIGGACVSALNRYRLALAHIMGHKCWSQSLIADNWSPMQRMAVEVFEDARIDTLLLRRFPGLLSSMLALHPTPKAQDCDPETHSCWRHRLARWSRAVLDPNYAADDLQHWVDAFNTLMTQTSEPVNTRSVASLALSFVARTRSASDSLPNVVFTDTVVSYRDDNRHLWTMIEDGDEEDTLPERTEAQAEEEPEHLPPRPYPEWDYLTESMRPDWVSLYEHLQPAGKAADVDAILQRYDGLAKQIKRMLDALKPQDRQRVRYQPEGAELDLDLAVRALVDWRCGSQPDLRVYQSHTTQGRDMAVLLLLDLSESLNQSAAGSNESVLSISRCAVALLAWAVEQLGDAFAIAGFQSNTRHDLRYMHIKGFSESFDPTVKARLAGVQAAWSTRMGPALRHAGHYLGARQADKKLLLVLTDGEPSDVDVQDPDYLLEDCAQAVRELSTEGIYTHCINLDASADNYVERIFGHHYTVVDQVEQLPQRLPELFMSLTGKR